jgi:hypothetical protein
VKIFTYITSYVYHTNLDDLHSLIPISEGILYLILVLYFRMFNLGTLNLVVGYNGKASDLLKEGTF